MTVQNHIIESVKTSPEHNPDMITIGGVIYKDILQYDDEGKELGVASVQFSHSINRTPRLLNTAGDEKKRRFEVSSFANVPGFKWCSCCGEWVEVKGFSPNDDNRDGLQSHCKDCRNKHAKKTYQSRRKDKLGIRLSVYNA